MYLLNSSGSGKSYLRIIKQGLKVIEKKKIKTQVPQFMWSVKGPGKDDKDDVKMLIFGYPNKTIVFKAEESGSYVASNEPGL